jgi:hypothetical protein
MQAKFVHLSPEEVPALPKNHYLMLNVNERIVTLLGPEHVCAQCRFPRSAFRILFFLLKAPCGADYAELLACLCCSDTVFYKLLAATSYERLCEILAPQIGRWHKHLERSSAQGKTLLEKELKIVRRAVKERNGASTILQQNGFALTVRAMYRKGYLLAPAPVLQRC